MAPIPKHVVSHKDLDGFIRHFNKLLKDSVKKVKANETKYKIVKYSKLSIVAKHNLIEKKLKDTDGPMKQLMQGKWSELKSKFHYRSGGSSHVGHNDGCVTVIASGDRVSTRL